MTDANQLLSTLRTASDGSAVLIVVADMFRDAGIHFGHGTANADDEAAWLVATLAGVDYSAADWPQAFERMLQAPLGDDVLAAVTSTAIARVTSRQPLAYLLGEAWFAGHRFFVNEHVLVPRSPIAELIACAFAPWLDASQVSRVLDIGTGSGCIAIATALALPHVSVDASDVSPQALDCAERNVAQYGLQSRVRVLASDVFSSLAANTYDLIVTNPPYVDAAEMAARPVEYRHEPTLGLAAGNDGLSIAHRLLADAPDYLNDGGYLILEVGASHEALQREYPQVPFMWLSFSSDAEGVTIMDKNTLIEHHALFASRAQGEHNVR
ncbi:MAG: 50S ribosomal protein L3 N(5)-glutamine methyltransferase [Pseudomonadota bacterium]